MERAHTHTHIHINIVYKVNQSHANASVLIESCFLKVHQTTKEKRKKHVAWQNQNEQRIQYTKKNTTSY